MTQSRTAMVVTAAALGLVLAGCGGDAADTAGDPTTPPPATPTPSPSGMDGHDMSPGDPSATPANKLPGAKEAAFTLLDTRPPGTDGVKGTAWLAQTDAGTTLTVHLMGLSAGTKYVGHLHAQSCSDGNGGPHFKFDPKGGDMPPNEVHLALTAGADGTGMATVTNENKVGTGARSVVIHPGDAMKSRLVCADFG